MLSASGQQYLAGCYSLIFDRVVACAEQGGLWLGQQVETIKECCFTLPFELER